MTNEQPRKIHPFSRPRNIATLLSVIVPGLGQLYNRRFLKGIIFIIISFSFLITTWDYIDIGLWGIFTLGTIPREHHSIQLLIQGLIALIILLFGFAIYVFNIIDARKNAFDRDNGKPKQDRKSVV